jgi:hypothetical protein
VKTQGLLKENAKAAPWILDPTAADARVCRGPRHELGSRVHSGLPIQNEGVRDLCRPCKILGPWTRACGMRRRRRQRQGRRGGASPEIRRRTLSCCSGRHFVRAWALRVDGEHASKPRGQGDGVGIHGSRCRKRADRPRRRAHGGGLIVQGREIRAGETLLTTSRSVGRAHGQRGSGSEGV